MDEHRRNIIINEIKHWKEHRLLPEHYCNFLLTLYTEGDSRANSKLVFPLQKVLYFSFLYILCCFLPITILVIYFTELSLVLQIVLFIFFITILLISSIILYKKELKGFHVALLSGSLIFLLASIHVMKVLLDVNNTLILVTIIVCCMLWSYIGIKTNTYYLKISGIIGVVSLIIYFIYEII